MKCDFSGWATKHGIPCSDGRTICKDAFRDCDGTRVPLVYQHNHSDPNMVLGHADLENREEGVYAYCTLNNTENGETAKELIRNGDITSLSIHANKLKQQGSYVRHGVIREVSLVLAGANPGASIDSVLLHGEYNDEDAIIYNDAEELVWSDDISHAEESSEKGKEEMSEGSKKEKTLQEVIDTMNEEQKQALYALVGLAAKGGGDTAEHWDNDDNYYEGDYEMKHNVFEAASYNDEETLRHDGLEAILNDGKRMGSLKESFLEHSAEYGIDQIDWLFPEAKNLNTPPEFIKRDTDWVTKVMAGVHHSPFSRIKSMFADITEDEARAKGYMKGKLKKEEVFGLLKRSTTPTTIYKKQKMDRDDVIDITDFDVVAWLKKEMRMMLDEELARAFLVGDGRSAASDDKINEQNIRPIYTDAELFTIKKDVVGDTPKDIIKAAVRARKDYKGSGTPTLFTTEDVLTEMLLIEDLNGRIIYDSVDKLANAMRVSSIVTVPVMENLYRTDEKSVRHDLIGIIVNLSDYNVGADKGGAVNMFEDFDIDYNQQKYLIETRCSGALIKPYSAIVLEKVHTSTGTPGSSE